MADYIDDTYISNRFFEGETVPGDNTINSSRNTSLKSRTTNKINGFAQVSSNLTDVNGQLEEIAGDLYEMGLNKKPMVLTEDHEATLQDRFMITPLVIHDMNDYDVNESQS